MNRPIIRRVQRRPTVAEARAAQEQRRTAAELAEARALTVLKLQLASGDTCIRIAAQQRGVTTDELKAQLYGRPA